MANSMRDSLAILAAVLRGFLASHLPSLGEDWWREGVLKSLSYQQRSQADEQHWSSGSAARIGDI